MRKWSQQRDSLVGPQQLTGAPQELLLKQVSLLPLDLLGNCPSPGRLRCPLAPTSAIPVPNAGTGLDRATALEGIRTLIGTGVQRR